MLLSYSSVSALVPFLEQAHCSSFPSVLPWSMRSISVTCSFPLHTPVPTSRPLLKHANKTVMLKHNQVPGKRASTLRIRSFSKNKVFEDQSEGVICYRDENGEIVCEGYDEGPRFPRQIHGSFCHLSDAEILDLLQDRWLQIVNGGGFSNANKGVIIVQDDSKRKDFNKFHQ
ncbi:Uncharacterized protein TCM_029245 [Theobroma cacao]|uniref:Uncharacterized protein n=1 Tax=Theobroma cacao TaxID=3641 RepID=A0A061GCS4_THECC|nr:Uncharacterized protein TCM_029245 [Theobroma cacao]